MSQRQKTPTDDVILVEPESRSPARLLRKDPVPANPPAKVVPKKRRAAPATASDLKSLNKKEDSELVGESDERIVQAALASWTSKVYDHYTTTMERDEDSDAITYVFSCKYEDKDHPASKRPRSKTATGTGNLSANARACDARNNRTEELQSSPLKDMVVKQNGPLVKALIALDAVEAAKPYRSFNTRFFKRLMSILGYEAPDRRTISNHVLLLSRELSVDVVQFFGSLPERLHLVIDGWTAPFAVSFLGVVVCYYERQAAKLRRLTLEFIYLDGPHTGQFLAEALSEMLERYGIKKKIFSLCMDNASNCDSTAAFLGQLTDNSFKGAPMRVRCFAHIINLTAKAFISVFFAKANKKRAAESKTTKNKRARTALGSVGRIDEVGSEEYSDIIETSMAQESDLPKDAAKEAHDLQFVTKSIAKAYEALKAGVPAADGTMVTANVSADEQEEALQVFPKVAGLGARDSPR
jgi:hypothetical protein